jgi:hypothetical protein
MMIMTDNTLLSRLTRRSTATLISAALLLAPAALLASADAKAPDGSRAEVLLETKDTTGQPWNASLQGWWGHEGAKNDSGKRPTFFSFDVSDGNGVVDAKTTDALHKTLDDAGDFGTLRVAWVPYSADGHNERPQVTKGENAGEVFQWFSDLGFGSALNGNTDKNDGVGWVSTLDEYSKWWKAGRPIQGFDNKLDVLDIANDSTTRESPTPEGKSVLNRWPAGTKISLVFYVSDGVDKAMPQVPTVKVGPDGRALTSWLTFETVASQTNVARTSGGYKVLTGQGTGPGVAAKPKAAGTTSGQPADAGASPGASGAGTDDSVAAADHSSATSKDDGGLVGSLPGGAPTFWILLVMVIGAIVAGVTLRLRPNGSGAAR